MPEDDQPTSNPESSQGDETAGPVPADANAEAGSAGDRSTAPPNSESDGSASDAGAPDGNDGAGPGEGDSEQIETSYEPAGRGHRIIRRTTRRRTTTEDIQEDIEEEYPLPATYPVPGSTHPAPVG